MLYDFKKHKIETYLQTVIQEFNSKRDRILSLTPHDLTIGEWREEILRNFIRQHLSERFGVGKGFIHDGASGKTSKQCDILIYDKFNAHPLFFKEGNLVIIPPEMAICVIEVKSVLAHTNLQEALENIKSSKELMPDATKLTSFIFSYDSQWSAFDIAKSLFKWKTRIATDYYPEAIVCLSKFIAWTQGNANSGKYYKLVAIHPYFGGDHTMAFFWGMLNTVLAAGTGDITRLKTTPADYLRKFYDFDRNDRLWLNDTKVIIGNGLTPQDEKKLDLDKANDKSHQCLHENKLSDAYKYAKQALRIRRTEHSLFNLAQALLCDGKYREAVTLLDEAISINDTHYQLFFEKGGILFLIGDYPNALKDAEDAIIKCIDAFQREQCFCLKYRILLQQGKYQEVLNSFDTNIPEPIDTATKIWKAIAMFDSGDTNNGEQLLKEILDKIVDNEEKWEISKAIILVKLGKKTKPKELIERFFARKPIFQKTIKDMPELRKIRNLF